MEKKSIQPDDASKISDELNKWVHSLDPSNLMKVLGRTKLGMRDIVDAITKNSLNDPFRDFLGGIAASYLSRGDSCIPDPAPAVQDTGPSPSNHDRIIPQ
jgi:hypothetical protein